MSNELIENQSKIANYALESHLGNQIKLEHYTTQDDPKYERLARSTKFYVKEVACGKGGVVVGHYLDKNHLYIDAIAATHTRQGIGPEVMRGFIEEEGYPELISGLTQSIFALISRRKALDPIGYHTLPNPETVNNPSSDKVGHEIAKFLANKFKKAGYTITDGYLVKRTKSKPGQDQVKLPVHDNPLLESWWRETIGISLEEARNGSKIALVSIKN